ncbi:MAG: hypothetical protein PHN53_12390, partial [Eubacteriales bacterium]|nr:hypothetical protein [Eubacteriales bacterium]
GNKKDNLAEPKRHQELQDAADILSIFENGRRRNYLHSFDASALRGQESHHSCQPDLNGS